MNFTIRPLSPNDHQSWTELRRQLWPQEAAENHAQEIQRVCESPEWEGLGCFEGKKLLGLVELSLRNIVDGCLSSPVVYLEAWIVDQAARGNGVGKALVAAAEAWGRKKGCTEMGSDTETTREASIQIHKALGFDEVDRVVNFRKSLDA